MPPPPRLWAFLCRTWRLPPRLMRAWWQSLARAEWSEAVAWRSLLLWQDVRGDPQQLLDAIWTPAQTTRILELLWQEGTMPRRQANAIQELLLNSVTADGNWRRVPRGAPDHEKEG